MDESSFTGEAEPCNKTDSVLLEAGDITTLSNVVFMGTLVRYGKGKVSPVSLDLFLDVSYRIGRFLPSSSVLFSIFSGCSYWDRRKFTVWRGVQNDAS